MSYFSDVLDDSQYAKELDFLATYGIMVGDESGNFNPRFRITNAEVCVNSTLVCLVYGKCVDTVRRQGVEQRAVGRCTRLCLLDHLEHVF